MITTLEYANRLKKVGLKDEIAEELAKLHGETNDELVTKYYLKEQFMIFEQRILIRLGGLMIVGMGILGFILKH